MVVPGTNLEEVALGCLKASLLGEPSLLLSEVVVDWLVVARWLVWLLQSILSRRPDGLAAEACSLAEP